MANNNQKPKNNNRIKELRLLHHKTQADLSNYIGVTDRTISNWEKGLREPKVETWEKLANYFNVSVSYLQGLDNSKEGSWLDTIREASEGLDGVSSEAIVKRIDHACSNFRYVLNGMADDKLFPDYIGKQTGQTLDRLMVELAWLVLFFQKYVIATRELYPSGRDDFNKKVFAQLVAVTETLDNTYKLTKQANNKIRDARDELVREFEKSLKKRN